MIKEEFKAIPKTDKNIYEFGILFALIATGIAGFLFWKDSNYFIWLVALTGFFLVSAIFCKAILKPLYIAWMHFAVVLGFVMTHLILAILFYLVFTPTGLLMRLFRQDVMNLKIKPNADSYWEKREPVPYLPTSSEKMF